MHDGFAISLWTYYEPLGSEIAPPSYADALMRYHAGLREIDLPAPDAADRVTTALRELRDRTQTPDLPDPDRDFLIDLLGRMGAAMSAGNVRRQLLHGEPHPGNLLNTARGPLFVDLETCCRGPIEFDLAHAPEGVEEHYRGADRELTRRCRALNWALFSTWRWRHDDQLPERQYWRREGLNRVRAALARHRL
jgi:thiamine kinase-like enzyme